MSEDLKLRAKIAERLRVARESAGLTQSQVASMLVWSRPTVTQLETGQRKLSSEEAINFAKIYHVDLKWLLAVETADSSSEFGYAARELEKLQEDDLSTVLKLIKSLNRRD